MLHALLTVLLLVSPTFASGQRGLVLKKDELGRFQEIEAPKGAYIGTTGEWHLFLDVETSVGGGMPFDHLSTLKVAKAKLTVEHGWEISTWDKYIEAHSCPAARPKAGDPKVVVVPEGARATCGT